MSGDQIEFHSQRAAAELDLARRASHAKAARAHFELSALHLERLERLIGPAAPDGAEN